MKKLNELQSYLTRLRGLMLTLIILCSIGSGNVWGADETLTITGASSGHNAPWGTSYGTNTGSSTTSASHTINLSWTRVGRMNTGIQIEKGTTKEFHSTSYPATNNIIKSIKITMKTNSSVLYGSTDGSSWTEITYTSGTAKDVKASGYKYFKVTATKAAYCVLTSIVVTYTSGGCSNGTITYSKGSTTYTGGNTITGSHANDTKVCSTNLTLPGETFFATGYTQDGWATSDGGSKVYNLGATDYSTEGDATLYPHWTTTNYTVHWKVNGNDWEGSTHGSPSTSVSYDTRPTTLPTAPLTGDCDGSKIFVGWSASTIATTTNTKPSDLFSTAADAPIVTEEVTFHAVFANKFSRVTNTSNLADGASIVVCHIANNKVMLSNGETISEEAAPSEDGDGKISPTAKMIWTLETNSTNWKLKSGSKYLKGDANPTSSSKTKTISMNTSGNLTWEIASSSYTTNAFYIRNSSSATAGLEEYNSEWKLYYGTAANIASQNTWAMKLYVCASPEYATSCADCDSDPTIGVASLKGSFNASGVGVTCPTSGTDVGSHCSWSDYGFIWSTSKSAVGTLVLNSDGTAPSGVTKVPVGSSGNANTFDGTIAPSPFNAGTYYYRAYGKNNYASGSYQYSSSVSSFVARSVTFNLKGHGSSAPTTQIVKDGAKATNPGDPSADGWRFDGWYDNESFTGSAWNFGSNTVTSNITLYAKWTQVYTVTYVYGTGGSGSCANGSYAAGETVTTCSSATKTASTLTGWLRSDNSATITPGNTFTMPSTNVTLTAVWEDTPYTLTQTVGANTTKGYTASTIKSGDTPLDLTYSISAANKALPKTVTISGGRASWTLGTDYTWTLSSDKHSATLHINATIISSNMTVTVTEQTRYTITWNEHGSLSYSYFAADDNSLDWGDIDGCGEKEFYGWTADAGFVSHTTTPPTMIAKGSTVSASATYYAIYGDRIGSGSYSKVTTVAEGETYLIACPSQGKIYVGQHGSDAYGDDANVTISADAIAAKGTAHEVRIEGSATKFAIYDIDASKYIFGPSTSDAGCSWSAGPTASGTTYHWWNIGTGDYVGEIQGKNQTDRYFSYNYNGSTHRFAAYKTPGSNNTGKVYFYKYSPGFNNFSKTCTLYDITITTPSGGTVTTTPAAGTGVAGEGQTVTVNVTPNSCKYLSALKYNDGSDHAISIASTPYTFTMPASDVTVTATFADKSVSSIAANTDTHRTLMQGTAFEGEQIRVTYNNGETEDLAWNASGLTFSGYNMSTLGNQTVSVAYVGSCGSANTSYSIEITDGIPVTFSDCGITTVRKYDPGQTVPVESIDGAYGCSGWVFAGWSETSVAANSTSYTPVSNFSASTAKTLYAVYSKEGSTWLSAFDLSEMHSGAKYVIVKNYSAGNQFALTNAADGSAPNYLDGSQLATDCEAVREPGTYNDRYRLTVTPTASMIWVVKRKGEHWTIYSPDAEKYLKITSDGYTQLTTACEDEFVLTEGYNDSEIDAESTNASGKHLSWYNSSPKYWNGYGSAASKVYWLTNNEQFSSTPPCAPRSVDFHGNGGTVIAKTGTPTGDDLTITEASRDAGIYLPTAETDAASCDGKEWNFVGWIDHEVDVTRVPVLTTDMLNDGYDALNPNPHYDITADDEEYWAVYTNTGDPETKYGTISFTMSDFAKSYNVSEETLTKTVGGVGSYDFAYYQVGHASELGIQINHDPAGYLKNTTSLGKINKITFSSFGAGTISNIQVYVGNTADAINTLLPSSCLQTVSEVSTYYPNGNYQFVKIQYTAYTGVGTISIDFGRGTEVWATTPECSALSLSGTVRVTSTNGKKVKAVTPITVSGHGLAANAPVTIAAYNVSDDTPNSHFSFIGSASADVNGDVSSTNIVVAYQPTETSDGIEEVYFKASASNGSGTTESGKLTGYGRHLPAKFVIATKIGGSWYALPNNMSSYGNPNYIKLSSVNESTGVATIYSDQYDGEAVGSKNYLTWTLNSVVNTDNVNYGYPQHGNRIRFYDSKNSRYLEVKASDDDIKNSVASPTTSDHPLCEFLPTTSDLIDYTLKNEGQDKYLGVNSTEWGMYAGSTTVRFLIPNQQPAPTITWYNDMLDADHATNKAENGVVTLPTGADPVSCNSTLLPTFCGWKDGAIATYVTSEPTYVQAGDAATTDKTYYAVFKHATLDRWYTDCPTIYTITYTANGGTGADHVEYTMNTTADAITVGAAGFSKEGSTFVGWTNPSDESGAIITPGAGKITGLSGDITLNAVWIGTTNVTGTVRLTASAGEKVATGATEITISSTDFACATALRITYYDVTNDVTYGRTGSPTYTSSEFRLCNGSYGSADGSNISLAEVSGAYNQTFSITYEPNGGANTLDHYQLKIEVLLKNTVIETKTLELYGRTLPASFAIATKIGGAWYALPNDMSASGTYDPILISVTEDASVLNWTAQGPSNTAYIMRDYTANYSKLRFAINAAEDANKYCLWAADGDAAGIRNYSATSTDANYGWIVAETNADFSGYTMATSNNTRTGLMISNNKWGMANSGYSEIHFIPLTTVETIDIIAREWKTNGLVFAIAADNNVSLTSGHTKYGVNAAPTTNVTSITRHSTGGYGLYEVGLADITGDYGKVLSLKMKIGGVDKIANVTIPIIVSGTTTTTTAETPFTTLDAATKDYDVVILEGAKLTTNATASHASKFHNLYVYAGGTLINDNGSTSVNYLEMRGGIKGVAHKEDLAQGVPHLRLNKQISSTNGANLDMYVNTAHSYALSVPFEVSLSGVNYANSLNTSTGAAINGTLDSQFRIMRYDGETRSTGASGWTPITSTSYTLQVGQGYVLQGKRPKGQPFAVIRFPFTGVNNWADSNGEGKASGKPAIDIYAHEGGANTPDNDKGWNLIANPYMATISYYGDEEEAYAADFTVGCLEKTNTTPWDGKYSYTETTDAYVTMPNDWYSAFPQYRANSAQAVFEPFKNFFIQTSANGSVLFDRSKRASAPRHLLAQTENVSPIYADINLTHGDDFAQAGLKIDANATTGYKFGEDQNIFENREALTYLKVYTVADGHYLVGNTLTPAETSELIPLEFYAPNVNGDYVFSLDANSDIDRLEYVILYDAELGLNTNLLTNDYTVELEQTGLIENRFSIGLKVKEKDNSATGIDDVGGDSERPYKFIYRDKMYILRGGKIYDATGKQVREIK